MSFSKRGGARIGAGRPKKPDAGVSHARRPTLAGPAPVHVTLRVLDHVYNLRTRRCFEVVFAAFVACCNQDGFRVVGLTVQGNHLHLLIEAANAQALSRGMLRLTIRLALGLNAVMGRHGQVFERYHAHPLKNPSAVRAAIAYILANTTKHAAQVGRPLPAGYRDPYTVGTFGDRVLLPGGTAAMVSPPQSWLLVHGWKPGSPVVARSPAPPRLPEARGTASEARIPTELRRAARDGMRRTAAGPAHRSAREAASPPDQLTLFSATFGPAPEALADSRDGRSRALAGERPLGPRAAAGHPGSRASAVPRRNRSRRWMGDGFCSGRG